MRAYLRIANPIVAGLVLVLCLIAAGYEEGVFKPGVLLRGGIPTYFLAKGLFCSSALFILGRLLLFFLGGPSGRERTGDLP